MKENVEQVLKKLNIKPVNIFKLAKFTKTGGKDIQGRRCIRVKNARLSFNEKTKAKYGKYTR